MMTNDSTPREVGSNEWLGPPPERAAFAEWWRENWPEATPQSASFAEAERCAMLAWAGAVAAERDRIGAALLKMHERDGERHNYWLCAWRELFGA